MADWTAIEPFDLGNGASLNGTSGGSGWSDSWACTPSGAFTGDTSVKCEGTASAKNSTVDADAIRTLSTGVTSGIVKVTSQRSVNNSGEQYWHFRDGTTIKFTVRFASDGHIYVGAGATPTAIDLGTYSINTCYVVNVYIDQAGSVIKARVGTGAWSATTAVTFTSITSVRLNTSASGTLINRYDYIGPGSEPVVPTLASSLLALI